MTASGLDIIGFQAFPREAEMEPLNLFFAVFEGGLTFGAGLGNILHVGLGVTAACMSSRHRNLKRPPVMAAFSMLQKPAPFHLILLILRVPPAFREC